MRKIFAFTDYKNQFGSKWKADPYRGGFNKDLLVKYFHKYGYELVLIQYKDIKLNSDWKGKFVIYTSSEEKGLSYKSFVEDIVLGLTHKGAFVIPAYPFLRANNNKVFMEILREEILGKELSGITSKIFGTLEELLIDLEEEKIILPCVIKRSAGSMSRGVYLSGNKNELIKNVKKISRSSGLKWSINERLRMFKHKGYLPESGYQGKFILQPFIPDLRNDWKVLIYGNHYYILNRGIKRNDFRASGSHHNYSAGSKSGFPLSMLDSVEEIYNKLDVPHLSLDFAYDGKKGFVHEFQAIHFGTSTLGYCDDFYVKKNNEWVIEKKNFDQEEEYVWGIVKYLEKKPGLIE